MVTNISPASDVDPSTLRRLGLAVCGAPRSDKARQRCADAALQHQIARLAMELVNLQWADDWAELEDAAPVHKHAREWPEVWEELETAVDALEILRGEREPAPAIDWRALGFAAAPKRGG